MKFKLYVLCLLLFASFSFTSNVYSNERTVKISITKNPPLVSKDDKGEAIGIYADIIKYIAKQEGWKLQFIPCAWQECQEMLEAGDIDLMMTIAFSEQRAKRFDFTKEPVFNNWASIYRKPLSEIESIVDLEGKKVAVAKGNIHTTKFLDLLKHFGLKAEIIEVDHYPDVFSMIEKGEAVAGVVTRLNGLKYEKIYDVEKTPIIFNPVELFFATLKGKNIGLREAIDRHLKELKNNNNSLYYLSIENWLSARQGAIAFTSKDTSGGRPIIFAGDKDFPPIEFFRNGTPIGLNIDLLQALSIAMGRPIEIRLMDWGKAQKTSS